MKRILMGILIFVAASISFAQTTPNDFSTFFKVTEAGTQKIPWYTYSSGSVFAETRYNFDFPNATSVFIGRNIQSGNTTFTPEIGVILGNGHRSISPEIYSYSVRGKLGVFMLNQVSLGLSKDPHFAYHWLDVLYELNRHLKVGFDEQIYYETSDGLKPDIDLGPVARITVDGFYVKLWYSVNPTAGPQKTFIGVGKVF